jgi:hypothetical protein
MSRHSIQQITKTLLNGTGAIVATVMPAASEQFFGEEGIWIASTRDGAVLLCMEFAGEGESGDSFAMLYRTDDLSPSFFDVRETPNGFALMERFSDESAARVLEAESGGLSFIPAIGSEPLSFTLVDKDTTLYDADGYGLCGSYAFNRPRFDPLIYEQERVPDSDVPITRHVLRDKGGFGVLETIQFDTPKPGFKKVNEFLLGILVEDPQSAPFIDCALMAAASGRHGQWKHQKKLEYLDNKWIVIKENSDYYCGGAYPDDYDTYVVFDSATGALQDTSAWLTENALDILTFVVAGDDPLIRNGKFPPDLIDVIKLALPDNWRESTCYQLYSVGTNWVTRPALGGYVLDSNFSHVGRGCEVDLFLPTKYAEQLMITLN